MPRPDPVDRRLRYLKRLQLLDSLPEKSYDAITELAAHICGTPISLVSLLDEDRQFFKSRYGLGVSETPIEYSFCNHAIRTPEQPFIIEDALKDDRFRDNPLVSGDPGIRFYAGIPLVTRERVPLGTLCVIDREPRTLDEDQLRALQNLTTQVTQLLEFRQSEIEITRSEHKFRALVQDGGDLIAILDPKGIYIYVSPTSTPILGIGPDEFLGKSAFDFIHPEDLPAVLEQFERLHEEHQVQISPFRFQNSEGEWRWIETIATNMMEDPAIGGIVANSRDVTEYKDTHRELRQLNDELALTNSELEQFAYVASHDLQEPLRMVSSFMSLLEKKYGHLLDEKAHEYIHFATDGAKRMKTIIVDLLDYSRAGRNRGPAKPTDLNQLIQDYQELRRQRIHERNVTIEANNLPTIVAKEAPLLQTLHSLLDNAIKYTAPDRSPKIEVDVQESELEWVISVQDNGIGIDPEYHDKIFVLFQRLHLKEEYEGTGIGLAVAKKQVESWGGTLSVESEEGEGSTFWFTVPKPEAT